MNKPVKKYIAAALSVLFITATLGGCSSNRASFESSVDPSANAGASVLQGLAPVQYAAEDMDASWDAATSTTVALNGASAKVSGKGANISDSTVTITEAGTYALSGSLTDGQIRVDAGKDDLVRLVLDNVHIQSSQNAALYGVKARKIILILAEGSENTLSDAGSYVYPDAETDEPDAAVFSNGDLTVTGTGKLTVTGNFHNGIGTKDHLVITSGDIAVKAANHGLRGRDSVSIRDGGFIIDAQGDGLQSNNDEDNEKGWIAIDGGSFSITAGNDGIQAETLLSVFGGDFDITAGGGAAAAPAKTERAGLRQAAAVETGESGSFKGLKAGAGLLVSDGTFAVDSADDAVHSNGDILIKNGAFSLTTGDDGIHADGNLTINGGTIEIAQSYEGLEGASVDIKGGDIRLKASDDGINAAGGNDASAQGGPMGGDRFRSEGSYYIRITGGFIRADANGDGIDSNGGLYFTGGTVLVNGPTSGGNGALDYQGTCEITGGVLIAAGSAGMAQAPGGSSSQNSLMVYYSSVQTANTLISLTDARGTVVAAFAPAKDYQTVVISAPALTLKETYALYSGGSVSGGAAESAYAGAALAGGEKRTDITLSDVTAVVSDDGSPLSGGRRSMGGQPGGAGGRANPGFGGGMEGRGRGGNSSAPPPGEAPGAAQ